MWLNELPSWKESSLFLFFFTSHPCCLIVLSCSLVCTRWPWRGPLVSQQCLSLARDVCTLTYVPAMLSHLCPSGCGSASSPAIYTFPASHTDTLAPLTASTTVSLPVSPVEKTWIQRVVGSLLFYARALDRSIRSCPSDVTDIKLVHHSQHLYPLNQLP